MNRNNIDFTKIEACACCGETKNLTTVHVNEYSSYTNSKVLLCKSCYKLGNVKNESNKHTISSLNNVRDSIKSCIGSIVDSINDTIAKQVNANALIHKYLFKDSFVLNDTHYTDAFLIDRWINKKESAFADKIDSIAKFKNTQNSAHYKPDMLRCPVCNSLIRVSTKNIEKLEINDPISFECPNHCIEFTDNDLDVIFRQSYESYLKPQRSRWGYYRNEDDQHKLPFVYWALGCLANRFDREIYSSSWTREFDYDTLSKTYGWTKESHMSLYDVFDKIKNSHNYVASKHCMLFCKHSPGNGKSNVCALTNRECSYVDGTITCKRCENHIDGEPIGNLLATHEMCDHYKNGECAVCCGKKPSDIDFSNIEHLPTCTFKGKHFILGSNSDACFTVSLKGDKLIEKLKTTKGIPYREGYWS